jgi:hypothetical protein
MQRETILLLLEAGAEAYAKDHVSFISAQIDLTFGIERFYKDRAMIMQN